MQVDQETGEVFPANARPITDILRHLRGGVFIDEASDALQKLVRAVDESGKSGKVTIELHVKKITRSGAMDVTDKITTKMPAAEPMTTLLFATIDGNLVTEDPHQRKLDLKAVTVPNAEDLRRAS